MDYSQQLYAPVTYYIGHHDSSRTHVISADDFHLARQLGYDTVTSPITNESYKTKILNWLTAKGRTNHSLPSDSQHGGATFPHKLPPLDASDSTLRPGSHVARLLLTCSSWIDLPSPDPLIADASRQVLVQEASYAAWCGAANLVIHGPRFAGNGLSPAGVTAFARAILEVLEVGPAFNVQIILPMSPICDTKSQASSGDLARLPGSVAVKQENGSGEDDDDLDFWASWTAWNSIRSFCKYSPRLAIALSLPRQLPPKSVQSRWFSEPLRILLIPHGTFVRNKLEYEVLSKTHQHLLTWYMQSKHPPWILLSDVGPLSNAVQPNGTTSTSKLHDPTPAEAAFGQPRAQPEPRMSRTHHLEYLRIHIQDKEPPVSEEDRYTRSYQDFLQDPLQPLTENLESVTYEVFEKDPVKYDSYERAIELSMRDWRDFARPASGRDGRIIVAVVGAGRGPLVDRALRAARAARVKVDIWAVEKNPAAVLHLQRQNAEEWNSSVHIEESDMRSWRGPGYAKPTDGSSGDASLPSIPATFHPSDGYETCPVDILVSELLGSFADNELSPECLDGVQHLLNSSHGVSIPASYSAHYTPVAAPKVHADIGDRPAVSGKLKDPYQIPYVVWLHSIDYPSTNRQPQASEAMNSRHPVVHKAWEFYHPNPVVAVQGGHENWHNARFSRVMFPCQHRGVCHGLGGYFEAVLYQSQNRQDNAGESRDEDDLTSSIEISTHPLTMADKSPDMSSWFPIFFPLDRPLYFPDDSELEVSMWRKTNGRSVWYEWIVECFLKTLNAGKTTRIRLGASELHSSANTACLM